MIVSTMCGGIAGGTTVCCSDGGTIGMIVGGSVAATLASNEGVGFWSS